MTQPSGKRVARTRITLNKRSVDALRPADKSWIAWDERLTGFGVRVQPTGLKSFIVNYRAGDGGRKAPNRRVVLGRHGKISVAQARSEARKLLAKAARGEDPAGERAEARRMPTLAQAFEDLMNANPKRAVGTAKLYREEFARHFADWHERPLDDISRRDVEARFNRLTEDSGWSPANRTISLLSSIYRRPCVDFDGLSNPVDLWLAGGGKYHRNRRRKISTPEEVLPRWKKGVEQAIATPCVRDAFWFGFYTGMRLREVLPLRWKRVDMSALVFRVEETKTGAPLELPVTRQLATILERRFAESGASSDDAEDWVFPSALPGALGHIADLSHHYKRIGEAGGTRFWYHGLRNCFITVAERDLLLPHALTKRLVNHAPASDITEGYAADWTIEQLRQPAQQIADRIEFLMQKAVSQEAIIDAPPYCRKHRSAAQSSDSPSSPR